MIFDKIWLFIKSKFNKLTNSLVQSDPIAQLQYEYDLATNQLKDGRQGLARKKAFH